MAQNGLFRTRLLVYIVHQNIQETAVSHAIEFIETTMFTRQIKQIATDDESKNFRKSLSSHRTNGDLIQKTGGLRKIRMATGNQGKERQCAGDLLPATAEVIYLVMAYPKSTKDSITDAEKAELKKLTQRLKDEV